MMTTKNETLYSLTDKVLLLQQYVEEAENPEELAELLADSKEALDIHIDDKLEGMMTIRQNKVARAEALKAEAARLIELAKSEENQVGRIENYIQSELTRLGYSHKSKDRARAVGKFNIGFKKLPPKLEIVDVKKVPARFLITPPQPAAKPDGKALLDLLKKKAEFLHGKKWTKEIDEMDLEEFGIKLINSNQKFEVK